MQAKIQTNTSVKHLCHSKCDNVNIKTTTKKSMCLIYNDTFSYEMHSRQDPICLQVPLCQDLGFKMRRQKRFLRKI